MTDDDETITSRQNPLFKRLRALKERGAAGDRGHELCLLEGPKLVEEALGAGVTVVELAVGEEAEGRRHSVRALLGEAGARSVPVRRLSDALLQALSDAETSQGVVALAERPRFDEERLYEKTPLVAVAVGIQDPGNLGGLMRTAEAAGATGVYLCDGSADPFSWKALRGSMGSAFRLPHVRGLSAAEALERLAARGVRALAGTADAGTRYDQADLASPVALVFGAEGSGLPDDVVRRTKGPVRVPVASPVESLNVGVAAGLLLYEAARQRGFPSGSKGR